MQASAVEHQLSVRVRPVLTVKPAGPVSLPAGAGLELECRLLAGRPRPDLAWARCGGAPLPPAHTLLGAANTSRLQLASLTRDMAGCYECSADNGAGRVGSRVELAVLCECCALQSGLTAAPAKLAVNAAFITHHSIVCSLLPTEQAATNTAQQNPAKLSALTIMKSRFFFMRF